METTIALTMKEERRAEVIQRIFRGEMTMAEAAMVLGVSERHAIAQVLSDHHLHPVQRDAGMSETAAPIRIPVHRVQMSRTRRRTHHRAKRLRRRGRESVLIRTEEGLSEAEALQEIEASEEEKGETIDVLSSHMPPSIGFSQTDEMYYQLNKMSIKILPCPGPLKWVISFHTDGEKTTTPF